MFEKIKKYYNENLWNEARVRHMVVLGIITEEQFKEITGKEYSNEKLN